MKFVWIKTQDGSPTLWNNEIGEPFRSVKGAFHESLIVFVLPAIEHARSLNRPFTVGEFGLGAGTNWVFFSALAQHYRLEWDYHAIERDTESFEMALKKWSEETGLLAEMIEKHSGEKIKVDPATLPRPTIHPSLPRMLDDFSERRCELWFHDPFGYGVNPEGYSEETLGLCSRLWAPRFKGFSYACNTAFQKKLRDLGLQAEARELDAKPLKKQSLIFGRF